jgi:hypothetical protein
MSETPGQSGRALPVLEAGSGQNATSATEELVAISPIGALLLSALAIHSTGSFVDIIGDASDRQAVEVGRH